MYGRFQVLKWGGVGVFNEMGFLRRKATETNLSIPH